MGVFDEDTHKVTKELTVASTTSDYYVFGSWMLDEDEAGKIQPLGDPKVYTGDTPERQPFTWHLSGELLDSEIEKTHLAHWNLIRDKVLWMSPK